MFALRMRTYLRCGALLLLVYSRDNKQCGRSPNSGFTSIKRAGTLVNALDITILVPRLIFYQRNISSSSQHVDIAGSITTSYGEYEDDCGVRLPSDLLNTERVWRYVVKPSRLKSRYLS